MKIPVYDQQFDKQPLALNAPKQNVDVPSSAFGAGEAKAVGQLGAGISGLGDAMSQAAYRMKVEEDQTKSLEAYAQYHDAVNSYLQGDGSEGSGVYNRLGGSAVGATKEAKDELQKRMGEISGALGNEDQRRAFTQHATSLRIESLTGVSRHEAQQRKAYQSETLKAVAGKEADYALTNYDKGDQVEAALSRLGDAAKAAARLQGLSPEATEQLVSDSVSKTLRGVAMRHITNGNFSVATELIKDKRLTGDDATAVEKSLKEGSDRAKGYDLFKQAMGSEDPLAFLDKQKVDPYVRDNAESRIKSQIQWNQSQQHEAERQAALKSEDNLVRSLDNGDMEAANSVIENAPAGLRKEFRDYMNTRAKGQNVVDDPQEKWKWSQMLADEPERFKEEWNSPAVIAKLSKSTRDSFDNAYVALGKKGRSPIADEIIGDKQLLDNAAATLGIKLSDVEKDKKTAQKYGALEREYSRLIEQDMAIKGRKLTTTEKQALVDEHILYKGRVKGTWWGSSEEYKFNADFDKKDFQPDANIDPLGTVRWQAKQKGVPDYLAVGMLSAESRGNQGAVSPKGATGLLQLMPATAKELGVNPKDANENAEGGMRYMKSMLDKFGAMPGIDAASAEKLALMAYNWGPNATEAWLKAGADPAKVPAETVQYVKKVLSYKR